MFISIVVPIYNVADYLHYAIDSLMKQTYQNFEVILVNDGSTDKSPMLCEDYANRYENIHVFHKENGGLSDARNFGVSKANSDWIFFLDPDDYLEEYTLELIVKIHKEHHADLISTKVKATSKYNAYTSYKLQESDYKDLVPFTKEKALEAMLDDKFATVSACAKLYHRSILEKVPFPVGKIYEDFYVVGQHLALADKIIISPLETYNYYRREGSIVRSTFTEKRYEFFDAVAKNEEVVRKEYIQSEELHQSLQAKKILGGFVVIGAKADSGLKDFTKDKELLRIKVGELLQNGKLSWKVKMKYILFMLCPKLYLLLR
ncbi:glycosyltransferase family 2 protein [Streptococcus parasanguinis]|uniref:glycosyltransferase family 2 protein n=1 Tax=Streptococcus parasanguinis TaxID=1318 RepID=UPI000C7BC3FC|nr:glycosyltransferase family 2 protein [Streptococcus parasanguinis]PKZ96721.1 glycosyl transferase [Streptococcus parasanguinis]